MQMFTVTMWYDFYIKNIDVPNSDKIIKVAKVLVIIFYIYHNISKTTSVLNRILFACCFRVNIVNTDIT